MKKLLFGLAVALVAFSGSVFIANIFRAEPKPASVLVVEQLEKTEEIETIDNSNDIHAWYSLDNDKKMPEVAMINFYLTYYDDDGIRSEEPFLYSGIYTTLSDDIDEGFAEGTQTTLVGNKLKFKTKKLKGIEYRFQGTFFKNKMKGKQDEKILRGTLQKFIKGKKVAEVSGDFAYGKPYCLY